MPVGRSENYQMSESCEAPPTKKPRKERNRNRNRNRNGGKLGETNHTKEVVEQHIWKDFPEDLFEAVIARLPIATFFRFRSVCQKWNTLLDSESFSQHCAQVPRSIPWFYTIPHTSNPENRNSGAIYDPCATKWHYPTISSLPKELCISPVASAGGLVCFVDSGHRNFYVCNPLTTSFKELPAMSLQVWSRAAAVGMTTYGDSASRRYMILLVECNGEYEVYDSMNNSWTRPGNLPAEIKLPIGLNFRTQTVSMEGKIYFMRSDPDGIVSYDTSSRVWKQKVIPFPLDMTGHTLAECNGRLMLVGQLTENSATCVCIWELQKMTLLWKEVGRMPDEWCLEFYGRHVWMTCLGNKGLLMLVLRAQRLNRLVTYNVSSGKWAKVSHGRKRQWIDRGTAFYPSLTAVA